jgi:hypothetical protein
VGQIVPTPDVNVAEVGETDRVGGRGHVDKEESQARNSSSDRHVAVRLSGAGSATGGLQAARATSLLRMLISA